MKQDNLGEEGVYGYEELEEATANRRLCWRERGEGVTERDNKTDKRSSNCLGMRMRGRQQPGSTG